MSKAMRSGSAFACCVAAAFALYWPSVTIGYYGHDFQYVFANASRGNLFFYFVHPVPNCLSYHPLPALLLQSIQSFWGLSTLPLHVVQIVLHGLFAFFILRVIVNLGFGVPSAIVGALIFLIAQGSVAAIAGNDGLSLLGATLAACGSLWLQYKSFQRSPGSELHAAPEGKYYYGSIILFGIALLCNEIALPFFSPILLMLGVAARRSAPGWRRHFIVKTLPFVCLVLAYAAVRYLLKARLLVFYPSDVFGIELGRNLIINPLLLIFSAIAPISSVTVFRAMHSHAWPLLIGVTGAAALVSAIIALGLWRSRGNKKLLGILVLGATIVLPFAFMHHVSEAFTYAIMPFVSLASGIGLGALISAGNGYSRRRIAAIACLCLFAACQVGALRHKLGLMRENGRNAQNYLRQLVP
ncbi:MAG: hypothetical protein PHC61_12465, partial [Chitinivibrionales bacterium]|nr:hypothetical protein [Chitinivibrionales bacterium]